MYMYISAYRRIDIQIHMYIYTCTYVQDGLVVPRALMAKYTADGALSFGLRVEEGSKADVVTVISASIEFGIGGCCI